MSTPASPRRCRQPSNSASPGPVRPARRARSCHRPPRRCRRPTDPPRTGVNAGAQQRGHLRWDVVDAVPRTQRSPLRNSRPESKSVGPARAATRRFAQLTTRRVSTVVRLRAAHARDPHACGIEVTDLLFSEQAGSAQTDSSASSSSLTSPLRKRKRLGGRPSRVPGTAAWRLRLDLPYRSSTASGCRGQPVEQREQPRPFHSCVAERRRCWQVEAVEEPPQVWQSLDQPGPRARLDSAHDRPQRLHDDAVVEVRMQRRGNRMQGREAAGSAQREAFLDRATTPASPTSDTTWATPSAAPSSAQEAASTRPTSGTSCDGTTESSAELSVWSSLTSLPLMTEVAWGAGQSARTILRNCRTGSVRRWRRGQIDAGQSPGTSSAEHAKKRRSVS